MRERQLAFELGVLARVANACSRYWTDGRSEVKALLLLLPNDLPGMRRFVGEEQGPGGRDVLELYQDEYRQAVDRRLGQQGRHADPRGYGLPDRVVRWWYTRDWHQPRLRRNVAD